MTAAATSLTIASSVYERLRQDILLGEFAPGLKLRIELVCQRYEAGNSPVREALSRLSAEGLVERRDQRGFFVAGLSLQDLRELVQTRCWLEGLALRESIRRRTVEWEERIVLCSHRLSRTPRSADDRAFRANAEWERLHRDFHESLIANCGSRWLSRYCVELREQADRYRQLAAAKIYPRRNERDEHRELMTAAIDGRTDDAIALLTEHYRTTQSIVEREGAWLFA